jgi:hypothetical protein
MITPAELRAKIIKPTCDRLGLNGPGVEELLLGTAAQESNCGEHLVQLHGPALGVWQMEPATHDDLWLNYITFRTDLRALMMGYLVTSLPRADQMCGNLYYACAMARLQYKRHNDPIPAPTDYQGQGALYKLRYNGPGAATVAEYVANAKRVLGG